MADIQSNNFQLLSKVIESAQSGYPANGLPERAVNTNQAQTLTLVVVAASKDQLVLQDQASAKRVTINKDAIEGLASSNLAKGDKLLLVSSNTNITTFSLQKLAQQNIPRLNPSIFKTTNDVLQAQWQDIPSAIFKQIPPITLSQIQVNTNTLQASELAQAILNIANKTGKPATLNNVQGKINLLDNNNQNVTNKADVTQITIALNAGKRNITLSVQPLQNLLSKLTNSTISLTMNIGNDKALIKQAFINQTQTNPKGQALPNAIVDEINKAITNQIPSIKSQFASLVSSPNSTSLATGIAISPSPQNIQNLGNAVKQGLIGNFSQKEIANSQILLHKHANSSLQMQLSLIAKPEILKINSAALQFGNITLNKLPNIVSTEQMARSQITLKNGDKLNASTNSLANNISLEPMRDLLRNNVLQTLSEKGKNKNASLDMLSNLQTYIKNEANWALPKTESLKTSVPRLLGELEGFAQKSNGELNIFIKKIIQDIKLSLPTVTPQDTSFGKMNQSSDLLNTKVIVDDSLPSVEQIKSLLSENVTANLIAQNINQPGAIVSQSALVNGLVLMLQASLQAKLAALQPNLNSQLLAVSAALQTAPAKSKTVANNNKLMQDLHKLDPRGNIIKEINKVLSQHNIQKLNSAEASIQGQDTFYYTLPNLFSHQHQDTEIVIKREQQQNQEAKQALQQAWQLNMRLDIGELGEVLAKVKLLGNAVDLNLYASSQTLKNQIMDYLPFLNQRLIDLGLNVKPQCFLGKIPKTLLKTDYQVVQAYV